MCTGIKLQDLEDVHVVEGWIFSMCRFSVGFMPKVAHKFQVMNIYHHILLWFSVSENCIVLMEHLN